MDRPYIICHMAQTVNGKIIVQNWGDEDTMEKYINLYEECHETYDSQAFMIGRVTAEKDFTDWEKPDLDKPDKPIERNIFVGDKDATSFAIAVDPIGKIGWTSNKIESGEHIVSLLTERVSDDYLYFLQEKNISYMIAGKDKMDFATAFQQLSKLFPIKTLMLEGGGHINGSVLSEGFVDEISLVVLPVADCSSDAPTTFETSKDSDKNPAAELELKEIKQLDQDTIWLKYKVKNKNRKNG